jgi:hypothetical protein
MGTEGREVQAGRWAHWKRAPFNRFLEYGEQVCRLLRLTMHGINMVTKYDEIVEWAVQSDHTTEGEGPKTNSPESQAARLEQARSEAEYARAEVENDFPKLRAHALMDMWGALEVLIEDVVIAWFTNEPALLDSDEITRVRVPLAEFQQLNPEQRLRLLYRELERHKKADLKSGVTRFESMLALVGLDGQVTETLRRDLFEVQQVRNAIAHRNGLADRYLLKSCPWMGLEEGDRVPVGGTEYHRYEITMLNYGIVVMNRACATDGVDPYLPRHIIGHRHHDGEG